MNPFSVRTGFGYDVHRFSKERKLILGGVQIQHTHGLDGHSDADVLVHALCDALIGAAGLGDIGGHFPDTDPAYKGISSIKLLERVVEKIGEAGYILGNADITVVAQAPKLAPYIHEMKENIAKSGQIQAERINIKATTTEGLGFAGKKEGIAAYAVVLIYLSKNSLSQDQ